MKQSEVREEVAIIIKAIKESDADVPSVSQAIKPALMFVFASTSLTMVGFVPILALGLKFGANAIAFSFIATCVVGFFSGMVIYSSCMEYFCIPERVRNSSKLIHMVREKVTHYVYFHFGVLLTLSALFLSVGVSIFLPVAQFALMIITAIVFGLDLSRFKLPSLAGVINAAKDEFKNKELQEFLNGVNKEKR